MGRHGSVVSGNPATAFNRRPEKAYSGINPARPGSIFPQVKNSPGHTKQALRMRNPTSSALAHLVGSGSQNGLQEKFTRNSQGRNLVANPPCSNRGGSFSKICRPPLKMQAHEGQLKPLKATWHKGYRPITVLRGTFEPVAKQGGHPRAGGSLLAESPQNPIPYCA